MARGSARPHGARIERMVARQKKGASPFDRPTAEPPKRVSFEVSAPTWALVQEAREALTAKLGRRVEALVEALARALLDAGSSNDAGRSPYQIALTVCESAPARMTSS